LPVATITTNVSGDLDLHIRAIDQYEM